MVAPFSTSCTFSAHQFMCLLLLSVAAELLTEPHIVYLYAIASQSRWCSTVLI